MAVRQTSTPLLINDPSLYKRRTRATSKGIKSRLSIEVKSEPILFDFDDRTLMRASAEAFQRFVQREGGKRSSPLSPATIKHREKVLRNQGSPWVKRVYAGGRTGPTPPKRGNLRVGMDFSERLRNGLHVRENREERAWTVNIPANRLILPGQRNSTFRDMGELEVALRALDQKYPWLRNPGLAYGASSEMRKALDKDMFRLIMVADSRNRTLKAERLRALFSALGFRNAAQLVGSRPRSPILV